MTTLRFSLSKFSLSKFSLSNLALSKFSLTLLAFCLLLSCLLTGRAGAQTVVTESTVRLNQREVLVSGPVTAGAGYLTLASTVRKQANNDCYSIRLYTTGAGTGWVVQFLSLVSGTNTYFANTQLAANAVADGDNINLTIDAFGTNPTQVKATITDTTKSTTLYMSTVLDSSVSLQTTSVSSHATPYALISATAYDLGFSGTTFSVNSAGVIGGFTPDVWYIGLMNNGRYSAVCSPRGGEGHWAFTGGTMLIGVDVGYFAPCPAANYPIIACSVDGGPQQIIQLASGMIQAPLVVSGTGSHTLDLVYIEIGNIVPTMGSSARWGSVNVNKSDGPVGALRITNLTIDNGATITSSAYAGQYCVVQGDSITEDDFSNSALLSAGLGITISGDTRTDYAYNLGQPFGMRTIRIAYAGQSYLGLSSADGVPGPDATLNNYDDAHPRNWSGIASQVGMVVINEMTNDRGGNLATLQALATTHYNDVLTTFPNAQVYAVVPFGGFMASTVQAAAAATNSSRAHVINLGAQPGLGFLGSPTYQSSDGGHPNTQTHLRLGQMLIQAIQQSRTSGGTKRRIQ